MAARIFTLLFGGLGALVGLVLVGVALAGAVSGNQSLDRFIGVTSAFPLGVLLLELGLAACWIAWLQAKGLVSRAVSLPPWWLSAAIFLLAVLAGWGALKVGWWWAFVFVATIAVFAPIVATGRLGLPREQRPGWSRIVPAFAWGALVTPVIAIFVQLVGAVAAAMAAIAGVSLNNQAALQDFQRIAQHLQGRTISDEQTAGLMRLVVTQPLVLLVAGFVLVFIGPVSEELIKGAAAVLFSRTKQDDPQRDSTLTIFLIGLAAGLGFATTENIFYAAQGGPDAWTGMIFVRAVTPIMHGTATALFALGWAWQRQNPQGWGLLKGIGLALALHMLWNFCAGILMIGTVFVGDRGTTAGLAFLLLVLCLAALAVLALSSVGVLLRLRRYLAQQVRETTDRGPLDPPAPSDNLAGRASRELATATPLAR